MSHLVWYTYSMNNMKNENEITEAQLLVNQEVRVTSRRSKFFGRTGLVRSVMADGRTLEVNLRSTAAGLFSTQANVFLDITLVGEITDWPEPRFGTVDPNLGAIANSVVQDGI